MKKLISGLMLMLSALGLILFFTKKCYIRTGIIVNSDGPTSHFVAGKYSDFTPVFFIIGVPLIIVFFLLRKK